MTHDDIIRNLQDHIESLQRDLAIITEEMAENVRALEEQVSELEDERDEVKKEFQRVEDDLDDTLAENDDLTSELSALKKAQEPYEDLRSALAIYLSWMDSPPPGMDPVRHAEIAKNFRADVDRALRLVP